MIYRGSTPTIGYRLPFAADQLAEASIAVAQNGKLVLEKTMAECVLDGDIIAADLSQQDTLKLNDQYPADIQMRVRTLAGESLITEIVTVPVGRILRDGVI